MTFSSTRRMVLAGGGLMLLAATLAGVTGCASAFGTIAYVIQGDEVKPACKKLEGKVAIVCRPRAATTYQFSDVAMELGRALNRKISSKVKPKKCQIVPQQKVEEYCDGMEAESDFVEIGKAMGADQVIGVDLVNYNHIVGTNVWQGHAQVNVQLIDVKTGEILFEPESLPEYVFPKDQPVSSTDKDEGSFQSEYIRRLANFVSKLFVPYDRNDEVCVRMEGM